MGPDPAPPPATVRGRLAWTVRDGLVLVRRELARLARDPGRAAGELAFPVLMVLLFGYVFGGAMRVPGGGDYRQYLIPGVFAMTAMSAVLITASAVAADVGRGVMDRFRSMPMARSAVPFGHTASCLVTGLMSLGLMTLCALALGWRARHGPGETAAGFGVLILFRYAMGWLGVLLGLAFRNEETADRFVPLVFPVSLISDSYVPAGAMPAWLRVVAEWNPVSAVTGACRALFGDPALPGPGAAPPLRHPVAAALLWSAVLIAVCAPLAVRRFGSRAR
ncbi:ABC transporter permease [Bailinhaonella thermotolerans]|uniref:Transport permease protein n=1 Tax=Bailinhaonella thermotolerans TaxID=1070861 RepID=A0A3A4B2B2_9ACTN|nr:ABC transporter permease [Bailinhaonella thermotolerans]RJL35875.1 ABC transporter permease [Bailinhaonella thermotolerans]